MRETQGHGAPVWFELSARDPAGSMAFYQAVFGWRREVRSSLGVALLSNGKGTVGAMPDSSQGTADSDEAPMWAISFGVEDCEAETRRALRLGASVISAPKPVGSIGIGSRLRDPGGAAFGLMQSLPAGPTIGMSDINAVNWVELATREVDTNRRFYQELFGWSYRESRIPVEGAGNYSEIIAGGEPFGGLIPINEEWGDTPAHWALYVQVDDVEGCIDRALRAGGSNLLPPFEAPGFGRIAMVADPTGASCYIIRNS